MTDPLRSAKRIYWDSCIFNDYFTDDPAKLLVLSPIVRDAQSSAIEIITSTITIAEVGWPKGVLDNKKTLPLKTWSDDVDWTEAEKRIEAFWETSFVKLVEPGLTILEKARETTRRSFRMKNLKTIDAADAIHLATAELMNAHEFHTNELALIKYDGLLPFPIMRARHIQPALFS